MFNKPNLDLVMAQSSDGYFAKGKDDDMTWTGRKDKQAFKLLTSAGNTSILAGPNTALNMPELSNRTVYAVRSFKPFYGYLVNKGTLTREISYSNITNKQFNGAKVIGGPKLAQSVLDDGYIRYAYISVIKKKLHKGIGLELTEALNKFSYISINFDGLEIRKYNIGGIQWRTQIEALQRA